MYDVADAVAAGDAADTSGAAYDSADDTVNLSGAVDDANDAETDDANGRVAADVVPDNADTASADIVASPVKSLRIAPRSAFHRARQRSMRLRPMISGFSPASRNRSTGFSPSRYRRRQSRLNARVYVMRAVVAFATTGSDPKYRTSSAVNTVRPIRHIPIRLNIHIASGGLAAPL